MLLSLILLPLGGALLCYPMGNRAGRWFAALVALIEFGLVGAAFHTGATDFDYPWISSLGISLDLKLTGQNILLLGLCPILAGCAVLGTSLRTERLAEFCGHLLLLLAALQGVFLANNLGLFYICYELMLLPTLLLVSRWGNRSSADPHLRSGRSAALKFLLYTLFGSLPMLLAVVGLAFRSPVPDLSFDALAGLDPLVQLTVFWLFFLAFAVKIPIFPLHGWLVDLYETCPTTVTVVVAGAMSKAGLYGLLRIGVGLLPEASRFHAESLSWLAFFSLLYGAFCALGAPRVRAILAYSSLSHLALVTMGIFACSADGHGYAAGREGALLQMLSHGLCTGGLFLILAFLQRRGVPQELVKMGGLHHQYPRLTALALVLTMAALGCPGLSSYPGEVSLLLGVFQASHVRGVLSCISVVLSAWYLLRFFQGSLQGPTQSIQGDGVDAYPDLEWHETLALVPLVVAIFLLGFVPQMFLQLVRALPWT